MNRWSWQSHTYSSLSVLCYNSRRNSTVCHCHAEEMYNLPCYGYVLWSTAIVFTFHILLLSTVSLYCSPFYCFYAYRVSIYYEWTTISNVLLEGNNASLFELCILFIWCCLMPTSYDINRVIFNSLITMQYLYIDRYCIYRL